MNWSILRAFLQLRFYKSRSWHLSRAQFGQAQVDETSTIWQFAVDSRSDWHWLWPAATSQLWLLWSVTLKSVGTPLNLEAKHVSAPGPNIAGDAGRCWDTRWIGRGYHGFNWPTEFPTWAIRLSPESSDLSYTILYICLFLYINFPHMAVLGYPIIPYFCAKLGLPPLQRGVELQFVGAGLCPTHWPANWGRSSLCSLRVGLGGDGGAAVWYSVGGSTWQNMMKHGITWYNMA